jgi:hypothetical protein
LSLALSLAFLGLKDKAIDIWEKWIAQGLLLISKKYTSLAVGTNKASRLTRQADKAGWQGRLTRQADKAGWQGRRARQAGSIDVPMLIANIFSAATNRTSIHNKTGGMYHWLVYYRSDIWKIKNVFSFN